MDLLEHEYVADASEASAGGEPEVTPEAVEPVEAAAEEFVAPEYLTAEQAAEIADARFQALLSQYEQPAQQEQPGEPVDLNEMLNPLDPGFGENFGQYLQRRDEWMLSQFEERLGKMVGPVSQQFEQQAAEKSELALDTVISEQLSRAGLDEKTQVEAGPIVKTLARAYYPEMVKRFGPDTGASQAMSQAIRQANALAAASKTAGGASNASELAALAAANREPGTSNAAVSQPDPGSVDEAFERWVARNNSSLTAA